MTTTVIQTVGCKGYDGLALILVIPEISRQAVFWGLSALFSPVDSAPASLNPLNILEALRCVLPAGR